MLLNLSVPTLSDKCKALAALPEPPRGAGAAEVAARVPGVLLLNVRKLRQRWDYLRAAAGEGRGGAVLSLDGWVLCS